MSDRQSSLVRITEAFALLQGASTPFLAKVERELDLSGPHVAAIGAIHAGAVKVGDVATLTRTHVSSASRTVDALVEAGLVLREQDPTDRRAVVLSLTEAGRDRQRRYDELVVELMRDSLTELDDDQLADFGHHLEAFATGMMRAFGIRR